MYPAKPQMFPDCSITNTSLEKVEKVARSADTPPWAALLRKPSGRPAGNPPGVSASGKAFSWKRPACLSGNPGIGTRRISAWRPWPGRTICPQSGRGYPERDRNLQNLPLSICLIIINCYPEVTIAPSGTVLQDSGKASIFAQRYKVSTRNKY